MNASLLVSLVGLVAAQEEKDPVEFEAPFRVTAGDEWIDVDIGHSAPLMLDWDGDGLDDLLVGQFGEGKLRIYRNAGRPGAPEFGELTWFETKAGLGTIPSG